MSNNPLPEAYCFDRPIIFIPNWLEQRIKTFSKTEKVLKNIDDLFSILIPADVSFYKSQISKLQSHPALAPYFQTFSALDYEKWNEAESSHKAMQRSHDVMYKLMRGSDAASLNYYGTNVNLETPGVDDTFPVAAFEDAPIDTKLLASLLGFNEDDKDFDPINLRVIINVMDADCLTMRIAPIDKEQSKVPQILDQTIANIRAVTQYYDLKTVMASPIGKLYCRLVLVAPNS